MFEKINNINLNKLYERKMLTLKTNAEFQPYDIIAKCHNIDAKASTRLKKERNPFKYKVTYTNFQKCVIVFFEPSFKLCNIYRMILNNSELILSSFIFYIWLWYIFLILQFL